MKDKKGNVLNIDNLLNQGKEFAEGWTALDGCTLDQNFAGPVVSNETLLILNGINNLQLSLNSIITQFSAILYAMRKSDLELFELMKIGVKISEYVNSQLQIEQYRSSPNVDLKLLATMDEAITKLELWLTEKGVEYLEDARMDYQKFLQIQKD